MIVCTRCGFENEDSDTFCGSCAGFLEWEGQKVAEEVPEPEPEPEPEPAVEHVGLIERVKEAIGLGEDSGAAPDGAGAEPPAPEAEPAPAAADPPKTEGPAAGPAPAAAPVVTSAPGQAPAAAPPASPPATPAPLATERPAPTATGAPVRSEAAERPAAERPAPTGAPAAASGSAPTAPPRPPSATPTPPPPSPPQPAAPDRPAPGAAAPPQPAAPARPAPVAAAPPQPAAPERPAPVAPSPAQPVGPERPAPAVTAPAAAATTGATAAVQPEAVKPGAVKARPQVKKAAPTRVINPGDKICGQCGEGNDPIRRFCRRCGASLSEAAVFALPWYKRAWRRLTTRKQRQAGERPRNRRRAIGGAGPGWLTSWVTRIIALAIIVFVVLTFVGPAKKPIRHRLSTWYHDVANVVHPTYNQVHPVSASASSSAPGHPPALLIDGVSNTSWESNGKGAGQVVTIRLAKATDIDKIGFLIGDTDTPQAFLTEPRPDQVKVSFNGSKPYQKLIVLKDTGSFQTFGVGAKQATAFTVTIESVFPSGQGHDVSITEVEIFSKSR